MFENDNGVFCRKIYLSVFVKTVFFYAIVIIFFKFPNTLNTRIVVI